MLIMLQGNAAVPRSSRLTHHIHSWLTSIMDHHGVSRKVAVVLPAILIMNMCTALEGLPFWAHEAGPLQLEK